MGSTPLIACGKQFCKHAQENNQIQEHNQIQEQNHNQDSNQDQNPQNSQNPECDICCIQIKQREKSPLTCGHDFFHGKCLADSWQTKINQRITPLTCPICAIEIQYHVLKDIISSHYLELYDKILLMNALSLDENMFFCPTPNCVSISEVIPPQNQQQRFFYCRQCFKGFCLICRQPFHKQSKCQQKHVQIKNKASKEYQECPKCDNKYFKTQGCNIVECSICKLEFCYDCQSTECKSYMCINESKIK